MFCLHPERQICLTLAHTDDYTTEDKHDFKGIENTRNV